MGRANVTFECTKKCFPISFHTCVLDVASGSESNERVVYLQSTSVPTKHKLVFPLKTVTT